ncbi:unnamed protein product [Brachionus calyciflorus]|uniref:Uncharacterized protein n=1 Tax=Brachionus calyciflorus TaxID=104777 RepID=A0A814DZA7_9BILA|nr:unnamed protein product [Brachionus calyciflorus]
MNKTNSNLSGPRSDVEKFLLNIEKDGLSLILELSNKNLVTSFSNRPDYSLLSLWNTINLSLIRSKVYEFAISCLLEFSITYLITGLYDGRIFLKVYSFFNVFILICNGLFVSSSWDGGLRIWNFTHHVLLIESHSNRVNKLLLLEDNLFASGSDDITVKIWNTTNFSLALTFPQTSSVKSLVRLNETISILALQNYEVKIIEMKTWIVKRTINIINYVNSLVILYENMYLSVGLSDGTLQIYETSNFNLMVSFKNATKAPNNMFFSSKLNALASCYYFNNKCSLVFLLNYL